jgi:hypothetical protein
LGSIVHARILRAFQSRVNPFHDLKVRPFCFSQPTSQYRQSYRQSAVLQWTE